MYPGHASASLCASVPDPPGTRTSRTSSVMAMAKTPSENASSRAVSLVATRCSSLATLALLQLLDQRREHLHRVAHDAEIRDLEDRRLGILVDRDDALGILHADLVLRRARDARSDVDVRLDGLARLPDL